MTCSEFLARFSEFSDLESAEEDRAPFAAHLQSCPSCRRYAEVVERGVALLRSFPPPPVGDDFEERVKHSIFWEDELLRRKRMSRSGSGFGAMSLVAAVAIVSTIVASPFVLSSTPSVDLPAIVVATPASSPGVRPTAERTVRPAAPANFLLNSEGPPASTYLLRPEVLSGNRFPDATFLKTGF